MAAAVNVLGLLLNLGGILLLFLYGMPFGIQTDAGTLVITAPTGTLAAAESFYARLSWIGFAALLLGTVLQIAASLLYSRMLRWLRP